MNVHEDALQQAVAQVAVEEYPAEAVEADLAEAASGLAEDSEQLTEISRQVVETGNVAESMESFMTAFMDRVPEGEWDQRTARQYRLGMTQILAAHGYSTDPNSVSASFESAGVTQTFDENRQESFEKSDGIISRLWEALKAAVVAMGQAIKRFAQGILNNSTVLRKAGQQLAKSVTATKGEVPSGHFEGKPSWGTYYHMKENGGEPNAAKIVSNVGMELNSLLGGWDQSFKDTIGLYQYPGHTDAVSSGAAKATIKVSGGIILEVSNLTDQLKGDGKALAEAEIKVVKAGQPDKPIPYLSKSECSQVASAMQHAADTMMRMAEAGKPIQTEIDKLLEALKKRTGESKDKFFKAKGGNNLADGADAVSGNKQIAIVRRLIAKYPYAMKILVPQVAAVSLNAWRHARASLMKAGKAEKASGEKSME